MTSYLLSLIPSGTREEFSKYLQSYQEKPKDEKFESKVKTFFSQHELAFCAVQRVLHWDNPSVSFLAFVGSMAAAWNLATFYRPLGVLFSALFVLWVYAVLKYDVWPEISVPLTEEEIEEKRGQAEWVTLDQGVLTAPELSNLSCQFLQNVQGFIAWISNARRSQPYMYFSVLGIPLSILFAIGNFLTGETCVYLLLLTMFSIPALVRHADDILAINVRSALAEEEESTPKKKKKTERSKAKDT